MKKYSFFLFLISFFLTISFTLVQAQVELPSSFSTDQERAYVFVDSRINLLIQKQKYLNLLALKNVEGYRVQVINTTDRNSANEARQKLLELFPKYKTYLDYQSPYFRVRVGDFIDEGSARELQDKLEDYFPNGVFSVRDQINIDPETVLEYFKSQHGLRE